ncbi:MAG: hypothetical protein FWG25_02430 [Promicromonosporaceae bacterium]|nr:hypothetical protein [Promicromonosporaceae bacterium]
MPIGKLAGNDRPREDRVQKAAQEAWDGGASVFIATIPFTGGTAIRKGMGHPKVGAELEAILRMGWRLDTWEAVNSEMGVIAVPLFVRPGAFQPLR